MAETEKDKRRITTTHCATQLRRPLDKMKTMTLRTILNSVRNEKLFGCVEFYIHVPEHLPAKFSEMCPVFKNTAISRDDIGEYIKSLCQRKRYYESTKAKFKQ